MNFQIRPYHPSDQPALYRICRKTGDGGEDVSNRYPDPDMMGHLYAGPYGFFEPDLCFILTADGTPAGYIIGARDTLAFNTRCEAEWFPVLRQRYPLPQEQDDSPAAHLVRQIHRGFHYDPDLSAEYPAHLHIDLMPVARGQGLGRQLMEIFLSRLRQLEVCGVHLGVGKNNRRAIAFYELTGFQRVQVHEWGILFGLKL